MDLLQRFVSGDLDAFEELFRRYQGEVYRWAMRMVRDPSTAQEVTIETFWRIYRSRARFDPARDFSPWARRIAAHVALDRLKAAPRIAVGQAPGQASAPADLTPRHPLPPVESAPGPGPDPEERFGIAEAVGRAFQQLPPKLRLVATLALVEGMACPEIAQALGISVTAVKSREFRAVRLLRKKLKRMGVEP